MAASKHQSLEGLSYPAVVERFFDTFFACRGRSSSCLTRYKYSSACSLPNQRRMQGERNNEEMTQSLTKTERSRGRDQPRERTCRLMVGFGIARIPVFVRSSVSERQRQNKAKHRGHQGEHALPPHPRLSILMFLYREVDLRAHRIVSDLCTSSYSHPKPCLQSLAHQQKRKNSSEIIPKR